MSERYDQIVVGGGMSGLAHAWWSARRGERVVVLEAGERVGGVIATAETSGYRYERAATSVPSRARHLLDLLASLPEPPPLVASEDAAERQFLFGRTGLVDVPRSLPSLLTTRLLTSRGKLRILGEVLRGRRRVTGAETLHDFVRRRFGRGVAEAFLRPFTSGIYGASPDRLGAADAFPKLVAMERRRGSVLRALLADRDPSAGKRKVLLPQGGMETIPRAIASALGDRVRLRMPVTRLEPGGRGHGAIVHLADGSALEGDEVTLAIRAPAQQALVAETHPRAADLLSGVTYVPIVVVAVGYPRTQGPSVPAGFGALRGPRSRARVLGATFNAQLSPGVAPTGHELVTCYLGGSEDPEVLYLSDDELRRVVLGDLETALGGTVEPDLFQIWRWSQAIPLFAPGHRARMAEVATDLARSRLRPLGSHATGVSLNDCCRPLAPLRAPLAAGLVRA